MSTLDLLVDLAKYRKRLQAAHRAAVRRPRRRDLNRRWKVLQFMLDVGAFNPEEGRRGVTTTEVAEAMGVSLSSASKTLRRLQVSGWVLKLGGWHGFWYLSPRAVRFAETWGGFLDHPWVREGGARLVY